MSLVYHGSILLYIALEAVREGLGRQLEGIPQAEKVLSNRGR